MSDTIATESGHWYDTSGRPCYSIIGANGKERPTTLRDARKLNLCPSVTEIIKCAAKPSLETWKQQQVMLAALTLTRLDGEDDGAFCQRVIADSKEQGRKAAERGQALHGALECHIQGRTYASEWIPHVEAVIVAVSAVGIDLMAGEAEHSFAHASGYGGKLDFHSRDQRVVLDFKGKPKIDDKTSAYDEHLMQLAAYAQGVDLPGARLLNVFVGIDDRRVLVHEWEAADYARGLRMFNALLDYWQTSKGFRPVALPRAA